MGLAMLFGAAHYLADRRNQSLTEKYSFEQALTLTQTLWLKALGKAVPFLVGPLLSEMIKDRSLQNSFLSLTNHRLLDQIFLTPLCPSYIYEAFSSDERCASKDVLQDQRKSLDGRHLVSVTQVYTPDWVVDHLLTATLTKVLADKNDFPALRRVTLLDPALGGGVFILQALPPLAKAYEKLGLSKLEAIKHSLHNNLFGLDIDPFALATASLTVVLKTLSLGLSADQVMTLLPLPNFQLIEGETQTDPGKYPLGSLSKALRYKSGHLLSQRYQIVVANPPYLGRKLLPRPLKEKLKLHYPEAASDLSQAFLSMALDLVKPGGMVGFVTPSSFLHLAGARQLRDTILQDNQLEEVVERGAGVFPLLPGEKSSTTLIVIKAERPPHDQTGRFISTAAADDKSGKLKIVREKDTKASDFMFDAPDHFATTRLQSDFLNDPDRVINYWRPPVVTRLRSSLQKLGDIAILEQGLATTDNARFLRYVWEVRPEDIPRRYLPYVRGKGAERWWSPLTALVLWQDDGKEIKETVTATYPYLKGNYAWVVKNEEYYFRSGLTFSFVSKELLAARTLQSGAIFDVGRSAIFANNDSYHSTLLAYLNSELATAMAHDINPSINFQVGDLKKLAVPNFSTDEKNKLSELATSCIEAKKKLFQLTSPLRLFQAQHYCPHAYSVNAEINADSFDQTSRSFAHWQNRLIQAKLLIDSIVLQAIQREPSIGENESLTLTAFAHRANEKSREKTRESLPEEKFVLNFLIQSILHKMQKNKALIVGLNNELDSKLFIDSLKGQIDYSFVRQSLGHNISFTSYLIEELPRAFDEYFLGQPPLIMIALTSEISRANRTDRVSRTTCSGAAKNLLIFAPPILSAPDIVLEQCGEVSPETYKQALALLHQARSLKDREQMRVKELLSYLNGLSRPIAK